MSILSIHQLSKHYGRIHAVDGLSLTVEEGNIYGILGPNGSGKTTTLGMILDIIFPDSGNYEWFEGRYGNNPRRHIGALLETPTLTYRTDPALIAGIELHGPHVTLRNSWRADLDRITQAMADAP